MIAKNRRKVDFFNSRFSMSWRQGLRKVISKHKQWVFLSYCVSDRPGRSGRRSGLLKVLNRKIKMPVYRKRQTSDSPTYVNVNNSAKFFQVKISLSLQMAFHRLNTFPLLAIREFKQIATATSTTAVVDAVSWGEYVS